MHKKKIIYPKNTNNDEKNKKKIYRKKRNYKEMISQYDENKDINDNKEINLKKMKKGEEILDFIKEENQNRDNGDILQEINNNFKEPIGKKYRSKSVDELITNIKMLTFNEKILTQINLEKKEKKEIKISPKKNYIIKGNEITDFTEIIDNTKYKNIPYKIKYDNCTFYIRGKDRTNNLRVTWRCLNYRKKRNLPINQNIYCEANIQGIRENKESNKFKFFYKKDHSE